MYKKLANDRWSPLWEKVEPHLAQSPHHPEIEEFKMLPGLLSKTTHFVDVGASYGPYTWIAVFTLTNSKITAIEANPNLCNHISTEWGKIVKENETRNNSLTVLNAPLSNSSQLVKFELNNTDFFTSSIAGVTGFSDKMSERQVIEIQSVTLDELFVDQPPDLIKIDIEGAEWRAIDGARLLLKKKSVKFLMEIHPWGDVQLQKRPSDIFKIFREYEYTVVRLHHHWLFLPFKPSVKNTLLSYLYGFATNHAFLRKIAVVLLGSRGKKTSVQL